MSVSFTIRHRLLADIPPDVGLVRGISCRLKPPQSCELYRPVPSTAVRLCKAESAIWWIVGEAAKTRRCATRVPLNVRSAASISKTYGNASFN